MKLMKRLLKEEKGQGLVEYALIIALIAVVIIGVLATLGTNIKTIFTTIGTKLTVPSSQ